MKRKKFPTLNQLMQDDSEWCEDCPFEDDCIIALPPDNNPRKKIECTRYRRSE